ncbi:MAG: T9SS type A sorting domain-containing protein [Bacteroidia bacterium]|nr:T9SS type A sorting domain-containing protein [Bacteroidia bacterium]
MKILTTLLSCVALSGFSQSFATDYLDIANIKAMFGSSGVLFWNGSTYSFEVPKDSGKHTLFAGNLWMGGIDAQGALHVAAQTYRQMGADYFQGPVMNNSAYSPSQDLLWDKVWKINKSMIDSFKLGLYTNLPPVLQNWPGNGNVSLGQAAQLAPYKDVNGDGIYNPSNGDYPCIKGDQAVYFIFNDDRNNHTESNGQKIKVEVHGMAYAFNDTVYPHLKNTVFLNYRIINRSAQPYYSFYIGMWNDFDIGDSSDDFIGSDVKGNYFFGYNGDNNDGTSIGYGASPPAQGTVFLKGPGADLGDGLDNNHNCLIDEPFEQCMMNYFTYYNNDFSAIGNPTSDTAYYRFTHGIWKDGSNMTYGGNAYGGVTVCSYMFPGSSDQSIGWGTGGSCTNPSVQPPWDETSSGNMPADRRGIGSCGPFTFNAGEELCLDFAFVFARGPNGNLSNITLLSSAVDTIRYFYTTNNLDTCGCYSGPLSVVETDQPIQLRLAPNPAGDLLTIETDHVLSSLLYIYDLQGNILLKKTTETPVTNIDIRHLSPGVYFISIQNSKGTVAKKFIKE